MMKKCPKCGNATFTKIKEFTVSDKDEEGFNDRFVFRKCGKDFLRSELVD